MTEFARCQCEVCTWLDTPPEKRVRDEQKMIAGIRFRMTRDFRLPPERGQADRDMDRRFWEERTAMQTAREAPRRVDNNRDKAL